jgi:hypothetical protein
VPIHRWFRQKITVAQFYNHNFRDCCYLSDKWRDRPGRLRQWQEKKPLARRKVLVNQIVERFGSTRFGFLEPAKPLILLASPAGFEPTAPRLGKLGQPIYFNALACLRA